MRQALATAVCLLWATQTLEAPAEPPPSKWDSQILALDEVALDQAYVAHLALLYSTWMKDYANSVETPRRVATGARNARAAYIHAMTQIEQRKRSP